VTDAAIARDFRIVTPPKWLALDVDPATSAGSIRRLVEGRVGSDPRVASQRAQFTGMLQQAVATASRNGAVLAFVYADVLGDAPVGASLLVFVSATEDKVLVDGEVDLDALHLLVRGTAAPEGEVVESSVVELPAGGAVRVRRRTTAVVLGRSVPSEVVQYFVPVPGRRNTVTLNFSTPSVAVADAFCELFAAVAETLQWKW
jgi:hypothetical protein